ncbi:MAG: hypothetical protein J5680_01770 [Neisseriaceae bacterium]|nr:hypothetical protein [Neisseriaceae bacterium]
MGIHAHHNGRTQYNGRIVLHCFRLPERFVLIIFTAPYGAFGGLETHPTAFLFKKLGFAGVSFRLPEK